MRDPLSRAEHYRKLAVKYRELAKFAQPAYLGDFYRGIAVRYAFMAQEVSERANKEVGIAPERRVRPEPFDPQGQAEESRSTSGNGAKRSAVGPPVPGSRAR
jgi:hypothetical protein